MHTRPLDTIDQSLPERGTPTLIVWPIVEIADQRGDGPIALTYRFPPLPQAIHHAVTRHCGGDTIDTQFIRGWEEDTHGRQGGGGGQIVIGRRDQGATFAPTRAGANFDGGLGIYGDASDVVRGICSLIELHPLVEDGVGCWHFFCG